MVAASTSAADPPSPDEADGGRHTARSPRPYWIPAGVALDDWPRELRSAVAGIVNPAYEELVLRAPPGLRQSTGVTVVHLLWLEILDHIELGRQGLAQPANEQASAARAKTIERNLRVVNAKLKATELCHRLDEFKMQWKTGPGGPLGAGFFNGPGWPRESTEHGKNESC